MGKTTDKIKKALSGSKDTKKVSTQPKAVSKPKEGKGDTKEGTKKKLTKVQKYHLKLKKNPNYIPVAGEHLR